jgi:NAD-dependent DNA ligase
MSFRLFMENPMTPEYKQAYETWFNAQLDNLGDWHWNETGVDAVAVDAANNETARFERLVDFFSSVDIPHLGEGNLRQMFDMGFDTPEKIIPLTLEDIGSLVGSMAIGKKIFTNMRERFTNIPMHVLMGSCAAFGRGVGVRKMKKLEEAFAGDMAKCADLNAIVAVEGFDVKTAKKIVAGYPTFLKFLSAIDKYVSIAAFVAKKQGHLSGKSFVFTGFRSKELEAQIVDVGGVMSTGVSSKTTYLVTAEPNSTSGKAVKARDLGVTVISQDELKAML